MPTDNPAQDSQQQEIRRLRELIAHNSDWLWEVDTQGRYTFCSPLCLQLLGYTPEQLLGRTPFDLMPVEEAQRVGAEFNAIIQARRPFNGLVNRNLKADGSLIILETSGIPLFDERGEFAGYRGIDRDISLQVVPLGIRSVQLEALYAAAPVALGLLGRDGRFVNANQAMATLLGSDPGQLIGQPIEQYLPATLLDSRTCLERLQRGEERFSQTLDWRMRHYQLTLQRVTDGDGQVIGMTLALSDMTEQHVIRQQLAQAYRQLEQANKRLNELVERDHLTDLHNRRRFDESLQREVALALRERLPLSLFMLDMDGFKTYNDHYGHQAGDECLRLLAEILRNGLLRPADLVCRYGGDEFAVILPQTDASAALLVAERLRQSVQQANLPHALNTSGCITISIGSASLATETEGASLNEHCVNLLLAADAALYGAKRNGRNQVKGSTVA
ncbi:sensor domain-containing diguanylate cyclase [Stutzerimonas kirkiae]|uniref:diguanylate cyclase n=1 Tax=Stutzerimonas kirkiae TaxID=2211392 RepID=A0A4V2KDJ2_9GAMM|nr:diguanylate cyclase [Stutzerimonas kirkiae]TBU99919.1 diguanylate cyclase [Stutzerimonas kirkiae]TBV05625.1 diguanylate cyclase [Stutzerimonas kirkiae]TBV10634.1 diguanylate cyclase [Stutzerimonas kirkiae]TBV17489.1 diguanylate cyclase [Stutzerimonas kirkiae]